MQKLTADDPETKSADVIADNVEALKALFPDAFTEGKIDFNVLRQLLGDAVDEGDEKYGLNWHGKRAARQLALTPSTGTLRPCPEESVDWDTTQNLMIEGDNLEVLKLLQKSYAGMVKLIYIDPPYNTGRDFVYKDNFRDSVRNYLEITGQLDASGTVLAANPEASGRFHTSWLNMMYPRLKIAWQMLREDGLIMVSIDEREVGNLRLLLNEIFGANNSVGEFIWQAKKGGGSDNSGLVTDHEYILCFARNVDSQPLGFSIVEGEELDREDSEGPYRRGRELNKWGANSLRKDRPTMFFPISGPNGVDVYPIRNDGKEGCWRWGKPKMEAAVAAGDVEFVARDDGTFIAYQKIRDSSPRSKPHRTLLLNCGQTADGTKAIKALFNGEKVFDFTKPPSLLAQLIEIGAPVDSAEGANEAPIVMDFFAGSGTTGYSVVEQNSIDGGSRRFILIQLPQPLDTADKDQAIAARTLTKLNKPLNVAELTKERLRRSLSQAASRGSVMVSDFGFQVFQLDSSNIEAWDPDREDLDGSLTDAIEHLKGGRSEDDILYELLLKLGLELTVPIETREIAGKTVYNVGAGTLLVCLAEDIDQGDVEAIGLGIAEWHAELDSAGDATVVFRDSAFVDDVAKTNLTAILEQHGLSTVRSL